MEYIKLMIKTIAMCLIVIFTSCGTEHELSQEKYSSMNISEKLDYLYQVFPDTNTVSRMTLAIPENINKIQSGKVMPSEKFSQRVDEICEFYIHNEFNNPKTLREFDPNFGWYDKVWDMDGLYGWYWFWGILAVAIIISALCENGAPLLIVTIFYFFCGLLSLIFFVLSDPVDKEPYPSFVSTPSKSKNIYRGDNLKGNPNTQTDPSVYVTVDSIHNNSKSDELTNASEENSLAEKVVSAKTDTSNLKDTLLDKIDSQEGGCESELKHIEVCKIDTFSTSRGMKIYSFNRPSSKQYKDYEMAYDSLILQGLSIDSLSTLLGVQSDILVKSRFGLLMPAQKLVDNIQKLYLRNGEGDLSDLNIRGEIKETDLQILNAEIPQYVVDSIIYTRNINLDEEAASFAALYYSDCIDDFLDSKFGFFTSIWQGVKYIFSSKESYTKSFEEDITSILNKDDISTLLLTYVNNYKHVIEKENKILTNRNFRLNDFEELTLPDNINPVTNEIKEKIASRGSLEAADLGYSIMIDIIGWLISSVILTVICNIVIANQCENKIRNLTSHFKPTSTWGKVFKGVAEIGSDIYYANKKQKIRDRYATYKTIAGVFVTIIGYIVTYFAIIAPAVNLEVEINQLLTEEFISYYNSVGLPLTEIFNNLLSSN